MKKFAMISAGVAALIAIPVAAFAVQDAGRPGHGPKTRAEVQAKVSERFTKVDVNRDGFITQAEMDASREARKAERTAKRGERQAERFAKLDADKNGQLSQSEFSAPRERGEKGEGRRMHRGHRGGHMGMMGGKGMMERADANKDGKLSLAEASAWPLQMFDKADANKDGTVTPEEHKAARDAMRAEWKAKRG